MALAGRWTADLMAGIGGGIVTTIVLSVSFGRVFASPSPARLAQPFRYPSSGVPLGAPVLRGVPPEVLTFVGVCLLSAGTTGLLIVYQRHTGNTRETAPTIIGSVLLVAIPFALLPMVWVTGITIGSSFNPSGGTGSQETVDLVSILGLIMILIFLFLIYLFFAAITFVVLIPIMLGGAVSGAFIARGLEWIVTRG